MQNCEQEELTTAQLETELAAGARLVFFEYCISLLIISLRRPTRVYVVGPGEWAWVRGLPYTVLSLLLGWWGLPWGIIYTPIVVLTNLAGGCDVTEQFRQSRGAPSEAASL